MRYDPRVERVARARMRGAAFEKEVNKVLALERKGRLFDAEDDPEGTGRREKRAAALAQHDRQMAPGMMLIPRRTGITERKKQGREAIQGPSTDFVGIAFLERAMRAARTVARVAHRNNSGLASGFLVSDRLFLTNNHVIGSAEAARALLLEFDYELDANDQPRAVTRYTLDPATFFMTSPEEELDFTLVAVGARLGSGLSAAERGYCPLLTTDDKHMKGEWVNIIQHPDTDYKQLVIRENLLVHRHDVAIHYKADTLPGSSGSPVFNDQWEAIALHHYGEPYREPHLGRDIEMNEGIRISAIVRDLATRGRALDAGRRELLGPVLNARRGDGIQGEQRTPGPLELNSGPRVAADGTITWRFPLEVSVRMPMGTTSDAPYTSPEPEPPDMRVDGAAESVVIDTNYGNRKGYVSNFLGTAVPAPILSAANKAKAARAKGKGKSTAPLALDYEHFSIMMNAERKMPFFAAVNIDGRTWKSVNRDGEAFAAEGAEASEKWFEDERINDDAQCHQPLYDDQDRLAAKRFDRGHMVRREYPNWGTDKQVVRANADTFHFTNCCPQAGVFNQRAAHWQGLENYVIRNADTENEKVSVFIGPVFDKDDPSWRNKEDTASDTVRVPMKFWKVLVRKVDGKLRAFGFIADQTTLAKAVFKAKKGGEAFDDMSKVKQYQEKISTIEKLTGLDFGGLKKVDTLKGGGESIRELRSLEQLKI